MEQQPPAEHEARERQVRASSAAGARIPRHSPEEELVEVLNPAGAAVAGVLRRVASPHGVAFGGRDEIPWVEVRAEQLVSVLTRCRDNRELRMDLLHCLFAVDYQDHLQLVYILYSLQFHHKAIVKVNLPYEHADEEVAAPSAVAVWEAAGWYERETHDLFGVVFVGNPDPSPLLLYEGFQGFPGRKRFPLHQYKEY